MYALYVDIVKLVTTFEKNVFGIFRFSLVAILIKMQMHEDPFFFEPSILNIRTKHDMKVEQRQLILLAFNYGMRNPESCNDGKEENVGILVLKIVTVKHPGYGPCSRNNSRKYTERQLLYSHYDYDSGLLYSVARKYLSGRPM